VTDKGRTARALPAFQTSPEAISFLLVSRRTIGPAQPPCLTGRLRSVTPRLVVVPILLALAVAACASPQPTPVPSVTPPVTPPSPSPSASPSPSVSPSPSPVAETDVCTPPSGQLPPAYAGDPCPAVLAAIRTAVAAYGFPIRRIVVAPDPFVCGDLWPGVGTPPVCFEPLILPGRDMHGWVSFVGTEAVAAVTAGRASMPEDATPPPSPLPWTVRVAAFEVPPAGWVMP
jgi:hypothetical protein